MKRKKMDEKEKRHLIWILFWIIVFLIGIYVSDYHLSRKETFAVLMMVIGSLGAANRSTVLSFYQQNKIKPKIKTKEKLKGQ